MGSGIAQVAAGAGLGVVLADVAQEVLDKALWAIGERLARLTENGKLPPGGREAILGRIEATLDLGRLADVDLVIEAVPEVPDLKMELFGRLDRICRPDTIFASNASSISIARLAGATKRGGRFVGMHFMNPPHLMRLVEVVKGRDTSQETLEAVKGLAERLGKVPVICNDAPGFVINRILMPMINEAAYCLMEGVGEREAIDQIMKLGANHPMGPLELADLIGIDVCLAIMEVLHADLGEKYHPCPLLRRMAAERKLGRKTGEGFYKYRA